MTDQTLYRFAFIKSASQGGYSIRVLMQGDNLASQGIEYYAADRLSDASISKVTFGAPGDFEMVDTYTVTTPVGIASYTTPSPIPSIYGGGGQVQSYALGYIAYDEGTSKVAYVVGIRVSQSYGSGSGVSRYYKHIIALGDTIAGFQAAVENAFSVNFPPDGQEFFGGVGLGDYTFAVDPSPIESVPSFWGTF